MTHEDQTFDTLLKALPNTPGMCQVLEQLLVVAYCRQCDTITDAIDLARARASLREESIRKYFGAIRYPEKKS